MNIGSYIQIRYDNGTTSHSPGWQGAHLLKGGEFANSREWQPMDELPMDASDEDLIDAADNLCREEGWPQQDLEVRIDRPDPVRAAQSAAGVATTAKLGPEGIQARAKAGAAARWGASERRLIGSLHPEEWARLDEAAIQGAQDGEWEFAVLRACRRLGLSRRSEKIVLAVVYSRHGLQLPVAGIEY